MSLTANTRSNRWEENFHELDVYHVYKVRITCFWAQDTKMSLTAISSKKIFHEVDVHHVYKVGVTCFWPQDAKMSLTAISLLETAKRNFPWTRGRTCVKSWNQTFLFSGSENESNGYQLAGIGEKKIFHELDVHHVYKVGITCFWAQDAKMSLTAISLLETAKRNFPWTRRRTCVKSVNQTFLFSGSENESNGYQLAGIGEKKISHELDVHHVYKVGITCFWLRMPKWV